MYKINVSLIVATVILLVLNIGQFIFWNKNIDDISSKYTSQIAELQQTIAGYGTEVTVYTVTKAVKAGDVVTKDNIETTKMYSSLLTEQFVVNETDILDRYFKIAVNPGTPIMHNMIMDEEIDDTVRDRDVALDRLTVGLEVGDYVDIRITMPYGDDYIVIPHKRIYGINEGTVKLYLNEYEWNVYQGALVDYFLNVEYGCTIYADKYVEPGVQQDAIAYYAVPTNIAALLQKNPNIVDKEEASSLNEWRSSIEDLLVIFRDEEDTVDADASKLNSGRTSINEAVESDRVSVMEEVAEEETVDEYSDSSVPDDFWEEDISTDTTTDTTVEGGDDVAEPTT